MNQAKNKRLKPQYLTIRGQESFLQEKCVNWFRLKYRPESRLLFSIPNGGFRHPSVGAIMKREGMLRGVSDLLLLIPSRGYHALCIECKIGENQLSEEQVQFATHALEWGYLYRVVRDFDGFLKLMNWYLDG